ncbi:metal-dependent hydrolase [Halostella sp. JP-L12]|uniref:metal-dependent hydrolase n=1 Tax=Halostella TaxID=1843185 RepID=UPI000EF7C24F|nr:MULTISPECIES: metal-dependent hydrolase [Halostella]NHN46663.1 metal-dependent hydrolase [Halostella sp. JP-L12]
MWPPGHLAVGYLAYALSRQYREGRSPEPAATVALAVGTQLPDLVDKPLSWTLAVLPTGRTLAHSVVTAAAVTVIVGRYARAVDRAELGNAFAIGYGSHLLADLYAAVAAGDAETNLFLFWPIVSQEEYATRPSFHAYAELVGWTGVVALAYVAAFAVAVAALSYRTEASVRSVTAFVVAAVATTAGIVLWSGVGSPWAVLEPVLVMIAAASWVRDGAPGLPRIRRKDHGRE